MNMTVTRFLRQCVGDMGIELTPASFQLFEKFAVELNKWNKKINLSAIRDERDIVIKHFADSLTLLELMGDSGLLLDVGSGAGFPAIPLKIALPGLSVVSVDSVEKKVLFQRHCSRILGLVDFTALHTRVEKLAHSHPGRFDYVVSRAFSDLSYFVSLALPLLKEKGRILAMKGRMGDSELSSALSDISDQGAVVIDCINRKLPFSDAERCLIVLEKKGGWHDDSVLKVEFRK
jgi:16S rRNA (guanine527-N7)-methyltransferase